MQLVVRHLTGIYLHHTRGQGLANVLDVVESGLTPLTHLWQVLMVAPQLRVPAVILLLRISISCQRQRAKNGY